MSTPPTWPFLCFHVPPFLMRQGAAAFNNYPLSFDTSSVTDMSYMFEVCAAHAQCPISSWAPNLKLLSVR